MRIVKVDQATIQKKFARTISRIIRCMPVLVAAASGLAVAAETAPLVVVPKYGGSGIVVRDMSPVEVSIWEELDSGTHTTTGRHTVFSIPAAYLIDSVNLSGGAQSSLWMRFDLSNERPWLVGGAGELFGGKDREQGIKRLARELDIQLSSQRSPAGSYSTKMITADADPQIVGQRYPTKRIAGEHCGFELFDSGKSWGRTKTPDGEVDLQTLQIPPFDRAQFFARKAKNGKYSVFVSCHPSPTGTNPRCAAGTDFEGWQMNIWFSGEHLCQLDGVIEKARRVLSGFVVERLDRAN
jgi:hypothetical protein